ncbi:MAG: carbohydrate ABC transporter permease, partial [Chloroflexota bacterium]|nr:carbohydrate ABC transporter permease [Chloroflexota bacterium]
MSQRTASVPMATTREAVASRQRVPRRFNVESVGSMTFLFIFTLYFLIPFFWLIVSATKNAG